MSPPSQKVQDWVRQHGLCPAEVDCATAVMLKILDGKCRMPEEEKTVMADLYAAVRELPGELLGADMHALIASAGHLDEEDADDFRQRVYEYRVEAETRLSRPVMKAFKKRLRDLGLLDQPSVS